MLVASQMEFQKCSADWLILMMINRFGMKSSFNIPWFRHFISGQQLPEYHKSSGSRNPSVPFLSRSYSVLACQSVLSTTCSILVWGMTEMEKTLWAVSRPIQWHHVKDELLLVKVSFVSSLPAADTFIDPCQAVGILFSICLVPFLISDSLLWKLYLCENDHLVESFCRLLSGRYWSVCSGVYILFFGELSIFFSAVKQVIYHWWLDSQLSPVSVC